MRSSGFTDRIILLLTGLLVIFAPVVILAITLSFLLFAGGLERGEITPLELVELYAIEFVSLAAFAYFVYRLTFFMVERRLPASLEAIERRAARGDKEVRSDDEAER